MLMLMALRRASYWAMAMHRDGAWKDAKHLHPKLAGTARGNSRLWLDQPMPGPDAAAIHLTDSRLFTEHARMEFFPSRRETPGVAGGVIC